MKDEKNPAVELRELKSINDAKGTKKEVFEIEDDEKEYREDSIYEVHPTKYYEYTENKEITMKWIAGVFSYMKNVELQLKSGAGLKLALVASILFGFVGGAKVVYFQDISFINFIFLQMLTMLIFLYFLCRQLDVFPFLDDEKLQFKLKISSVSFLAFLIIYMYSWNFWPRNHSHLVLCALPAIENLKESFSIGFNKRMVMWLALNYFGFFIMLNMTVDELPQSLKGFALASVAVLLFFVGFQQLKSVGASNMISIGTVISLVVTIFLPGFFGILKGEPPSIIDFLLILILGIVTSIASLLMIRAIQITKPSHCLLVGSIALALTSLIRDINILGFLVKEMIGFVIAVIGAVVILYEQADKTTKKKDPLITNN